MCNVSFNVACLSIGRLKLLNDSSRVCVTFRSTSPASALGGLKLLNDSSRVCVTFRSTSPASALGGLKLLNDSSRVCVRFVQRRLPQHWEG